MSKFLTPPVWYDKNGNLNEMLTGNAGTSSDIAIGSGATAVGGGIAIGGSAGRGGVAIGGGASANEENGIAIGNSATLSEGGVIAIGHGATAGAPDSIAIGLNATVSESGCIAIGSAANVSTSDTIQLGNNDLRYTLNIGDGTGTINTGTITLNGVRLSASGGVIQLGNNKTAYTLSVGNGTGALEIANISCDDLRVKVRMSPPLVGFDLNNNFDSGYVDIGNNSDGSPWSYSFSLVTNENELYKMRINSIPYLLVRVTLKPDVGLPTSLVYPILIPNKDVWVCRSQWNVIEIDENLNSILSMRLSSSLDNVGNPKITIALRSPSGHAINQDHKKVALEVVRVLNTNFTTP